MINVTTGKSSVQVQERKSSKTVPLGANEGTEFRTARFDASQDLAPPVTHQRGENTMVLPVPRRVNAKLVSLLRPNSLEAGRYHRLRHTVERMAAGTEGDNGVVIAITSPQSGDGKTLTAINLAGALAQDPSARVLLMELDVRQTRNTVKEYLGARKLSTLGVVDLARDDSLALEKAVQYVTDFNLYLLPAGKADTPYELLTSARLAGLMQEARERYDYIIVDTAPIVPVPDSQLISALVDGFMVLVAADVTSSKMLEEALNLLEPDKVLGLVFNGAPTGDTHAY